MWPAAIDALNHEHDIRGAIGHAGDRTDGSCEVAAHVLLGDFELPMTLAFDIGSEVVSSMNTGGSMYEVVTSAFEITLMRLGRRSRDQLFGLAWHPPLSSVPGEFFVFGPRRTALTEFPQPHWR